METPRDGIENEVSEAIHKILSLRYQIAIACGRYRPFDLPDYASIRDGTVSPFAYGSKDWLERYRTPAIVHIFNSIGAAVKLTVDGNVCALNARCIHALRITNFYLRTTWIRKTDFTCPSSVIYMCSELILFGMSTSAAGLSVRRKKETDIEWRLTAMINECHSRHTTVKSIYRYRFLDNYYTEDNQTVGDSRNTVTTGRWKTAVSDVFRDIQPDINYARRLALYELTTHRCTNMTDGQLLSFNHMLSECQKVHPDLLLCVDYIGLLNRGFIMGRARLYRKLLEVNPKHCGCFAKCVGPIGREKIMEQHVWNSFDKQAGLLVCGACRLSPIIDNTTSEKPRKTHSSISAEVESCSVDGCTSFKFVRLVVQDVRITEKGDVHTRYAHRFFTTDSVNVTDEVNRRKKKGTRARYYGMCFNGNRTCTKRFIIESPSATSEDARVTPAYTNTAYWFRCENCRLDMNDYGAVSSLALNSHSAASTCLRRYFSEADFEKEHICRGCKIAATCSHMDAVLLDKVKSVGATDGLLKRIMRLAALRRWMSTLDCWM